MDGQKVKVAGSYSSPPALEAGGPWRLAGIPSSAEPPASSKLMRLLEMTARCSCSSRRAYAELGSTIATGVPGSLGMQCTLSMPATGKMTAESCEGDNTHVRRSVKLTQQGRQAAGAGSRRLRQPLLTHPTGQRTSVRFANRSPAADVAEVPGGATPSTPGCCSPLKPKAPPTLAKRLLMSSGADVGCAACCPAMVGLYISAKQHAQGRHPCIFRARTRVQPGAAFTHLPTQQLSCKSMPQPHKCTFLS